MIDKRVAKKLDRIIKEVWLQDICREYGNGFLAQESGLCCGVYHHLRARLDPLLIRHSLFLYPGFTFKDTRYCADLVICRMNMEKEAYYLEERLTDIAAVIQLSFGGSPHYYRTDIPRFKEHLDELGYPCQYYLGVIQESEAQVRLPWLDQRALGRWAPGCFTELTTQTLDDGMYFTMRSYNNMNLQHKQTPCEFTC